MDFRLRGVHRPSGKVVDKRIRDATEDKVRRWAEQNDITVVALDVLEETKGLAAMPVAQPVRVQPIPVLESGHVAGAPVVNVATPRRGSSLGVGALILGCLAFLICWIPLLGILGLPLSGIGVLLGVAGLVVALTRRGSGAGFAIAGTAVSALALAIGGVNLAVSRAAAQALAGQGASSRAPGAQAASAPACRMGVPLRAGDMEITVTAASVGLLEVDDGMDTGRSKDQLLRVEMSIRNTSDAHKSEWRGLSWNGIGTSWDEQATMVDEHGNEYRRANFGLRSRLAGAVGAGESVYPGKQVTDAVAFEPPVDKATMLTLTIPGKCVGVDGDLRFAIPVAEVRR